MFRRVLRYILLSIIGLALLTCCWYGHHVTANGDKGILCTKLNIEIKDNSGNTFVDREDLDALINHEYGSFYGKRVDSLDLCKIEDAILKHTAIKAGEVYVKRDSTLNISITQKTPFLRFQNGDNGFYIEEDGNIFPLQARHSARVQIIDGNFPVKVEQGYCGYVQDEAEKKWLDGMIALVEYVNKSKVWSKNIAQYHVDNNGDIVLIPSEGREKIIFGSPTEFSRKFKQLESYYTSIKPTKEEDYYYTVNLKFENQIICRQ